MLLALHKSNYVLRLKLSVRFGCLWLLLDVGLAGVGVAVPDTVHEFRIRKLKETGANAYRAAHSCATPIVLDL